MLDECSKWATDGSELRDQKAECVAENLSETEGQMQPMKIVEGPRHVTESRLRLIVLSSLRARPCLFPTH